MSSAMMMMERGMSMPGMTTPGMSPQTPVGMPAMMMVPRCTIRMEKCAGGMKMVCTCDDEIACGAMQNLCKMLAGGMCSCCCTWNGMMMCQCNLCCANCQCEMTKDGLLHYLHQRRQEVLRDAASLLRLPERLHGIGLLLLCLLRQHAGLLRHLLSPGRQRAVSFKPCETKQFAGIETIG